MITKVASFFRYRYYKVGAVISRKYYGEPPRCDAHMNELPVPCGPWDTWYSDKQSKYNKILFGGVLWFLFSFGLMIYTDSLYLNCSPPAQPGPPSDLMEECEDEV